MILGGNSQTAAFTMTGSDRGELLLYPAAFTAFTLNTYFSPVVRPWHTNLNTMETTGRWVLQQLMELP